MRMMRRNPALERNEQPANSASPVSAGTAPPRPRTLAQGLLRASPSERAKNECASRRSAGGEGGGELIPIDISVCSVYLVMVPCRDSMDKQPSIRPFRDRVYSDA